LWKNGTSKQIKGLVRFAQAAGQPHEAAYYSGNAMTLVQVTRPQGLGRA
jgi:hypothetical protein